LDRALQGQYPPGSAFKPFIALSALRDRVVSTGRTYPCPPSYRVPGDTSGTVFKNWAFPADLGSMTLAQALVESCDTVFYPMGYAYWGLYYPPTNPPKLPLERDLGEFGFGKPTLIDLPGETNHGLIPTPESKQTSLHQQFLPGDFINMSIGQGGVLATPLQVADAYAAIANGGHLCVPHVATQIQTPDGANRRIKAECHKLPFSASDIQYVRNAMEGVVRPPGTAASAFTGFPFARVPVAGKTGTAQVNGEQDSSWFAAIAGSGADQYVIVALVQQGGHGSTTAAPIVRRVIEGLFGLGTSPKIQTQAPQD